MAGAAEQWRFLVYDLRWQANRRWYRVVSITFSRSAWAVVHYRFERAMWLMFGRGWSAARLVLSPLWMTLEVITNCEIHYKADIGPGIRILHPSLGLVVSARAVIGRHTYFTGGNCIGIKPRHGDGPIVIGDGCVLGANASVIGPLTLANKVTVGAGAVAVKDCLIDGTNLHGVPAVPSRQPALAGEL